MTDEGVRNPLGVCSSGIFEWYSVNSVHVCQIPSFRCFLSFAGVLIGVLMNGKSRLVKDCLWHDYVKSQIGPSLLNFKQHWPRFLSERALPLIPDFKMAIEEEYKINSATDIYPSEQCYFVKTLNE